MFAQVASILRSYGIETESSMPCGLDTTARFNRVFCFAPFLLAVTILLYYLLCRVFVVKVKLTAKAAKAGDRDRFLRFFSMLTVELVVHLYMGIYGVLGAYRSMSSTAAHYAL